MTFFKMPFYLLIFVQFSSLFFFDNQSNQYFPLIFIGFSLGCFEVINFYNLSLHIVTKKRKKEEWVSNFQLWALGYLGGLISLALVFVILNFLSKDRNYEIFGESVFLFIGPFCRILDIYFWYKVQYNKNLEINFSLLRI